MPAGVDKNLFKPKPLDGEVESFEVNTFVFSHRYRTLTFPKLMSQDEVIYNLKAGKFKPNCGVGKRIPMLTSTRL